MMYLLLRNNKQSGPYTFEELKTMGLKAYDLVWVDGKSAAWRYPSEITELSAFAPAVEEQPFDRFFKKPAPASTGMPSPMPMATSTIGVSGPPPAEIPGTSNRRNIYVTMPAVNGSYREPARVATAQATQQTVADES